MKPDKLLFLSAVFLFLTLMAAVIISAKTDIDGRIQVEVSKNAD